MKCLLPHQTSYLPTSKTHNMFLAALLLIIVIAVLYGSFFRNGNTGAEQKSYVDNPLDDTVGGMVSGLFLDKKTRVGMRKFRRIQRNDPKLQQDMQELLDSSKKIRELLDEYCEKYPDSPLCKDK